MILSSRIHGSFVRLRTMSRCVGLCSLRLVHVHVHVPNIESQQKMTQRKSDLEQSCGRTQHSSCRTLNSYETCEISQDLGLLCLRQSTAKTEEHQGLSAIALVRYTSSFRAMDPHQE